MIEKLENDGTWAAMGWWKPLKVKGWSFDENLFFSDIPPWPHLTKSCGCFQGPTDDGDLAERAATHVPSLSAGDSDPQYIRKGLYIM